MTVYGLFNDGASVLNAQMLRQVITLFSENVSVSGDALDVAGGVRITAIAPNALKVAAGSSGLTVTVQPGMCVIPGDATLGQGAYCLVNDSVKTVTLSDADGSQARYDRLVAQVTDTGDETTVYDIVPVAGTPAGSPAIPATPTNALSLGTVLVPAGADAPGDLTVADTRIPLLTVLHPHPGFTMGPTTTAAGRTATSSTFASLYIAQFRRRLPSVDFMYLQNTPSGSTGEIRMLVNSVQVGSSDNTLAGTGYNHIFGEVPAGVNYNDNITVELQARLVTGAGPITVQFINGYAF